MAELRGFAVFFLLSPLFAMVFGFVVALIASVLTRGAATKYLSRPVTLLYVGYAAITSATFYMLADGDGGRRVGPFVGTVLSFVLVVYLRRFRRRRAGSKKSTTSKKSGDRWRVARRSRGGMPGDGGSQPGSGGNGDSDEAGPMGWAPGRPRPVAQPPTLEPPRPGAAGPGGHGPGRPGRDFPGRDFPGRGRPGRDRPGRDGPRRFGPPDDGTDPGSEPPYGSRPPPGPV